MDSYLTAIVIDAEQRINGILAQVDTIENTQNVLEENQIQILQNQARILRDLHIIGLYLGELSHLTFRDYDSAGDIRDIIDEFYAHDHTLKKEPEKKD